MFTYIDSLEDLSFLNKELLQKPYLGVDTEFRRTTKDNMRLALLQVNDGEEIFLIDAVLINDPEDNCDFLFSSSVIKIFHSCKEDLEAIYSWTGSVMKNLFDTQLANAFLGGHYSIGYQGLVEERLDITLDKKETRSNWIRRPLSDSQLSYAASDVYYLIDLYRLQREEFSETYKLEWVEEESNKPFALDSFIESPKSRQFSIQKKEENHILTELNKIVNEISLNEEINPTLFFSKQNQKILINNTLSLGLDEALKGITKWRTGLIKEPFSVLMNSFGVS